MRQVGEFSYVQVRLVGEFSSGLIVLFFFFYRGLQLLIFLYVSLFICWFQLFLGGRSWYIAYCGLHEFGC